MSSEDIIGAFKSGNVPNSAVITLCKGRDGEIKEFERLLGKVEDGKAMTKFVKGEFGAGKSFFLKVIEEMAFERNFAVSRIVISNNLPFNKIDLIYKEIARNLKVKTGKSLNHIIEKWINELKVEALQEYQSAQKQNEFVENRIREDLALTNEFEDSFATAIEYYSELTNIGDYSTANKALAWLRGGSNIPYTTKKKFGVKGDITKDNALHFLEALSIFVKSVGYSGLVVLIDECEFIMNLQTSKLRDVSYNYIRDIYDECENGKYKSSLFVFAGTPPFFEDPKKGVPSYPALQDRLEDSIDSKDVDLRKPIFELNDFEEENLREIADAILKTHADAFNWRPKDKIEPIIGEIIENITEETALLGGRLTPRIFIKKFTTVLDIIEQNKNKYKTEEDILDLFESQEVDNVKDDFDEFDDDDDWD